MRTKAPAIENPSRLALKPTGHTPVCGRNGAESEL
jgi:hypothetical protein